MIELRWVEREIVSGGTAHNGTIIEIFKTKVKVLQYRIRQNMDELGLQKPIWSAWQDVPTVSADDNFI